MKVNKDKFTEIITDVYLYEDTVNVYLLKEEEKGVLIDFGSGDVLDKMGRIGIKKITDILITHHHRDQVQGLKRAVEENIRIHVPHMEQDLFVDLEAHWQGRELYNNYNNRQDKFSLLKEIEIDKTLKDYHHLEIGKYNFYIHSTPGHTNGSISIITEILTDQTKKGTKKKIAFTGDLIYGPGKVWSMAATQWSYNGAEGAAATIASLLDLSEMKLDFLLPSHGVIMNSPVEAMESVIERLWSLLKYRKQNPRLFKLREKPYQKITPHLLWNRASMSDAYVLLSDSGKALFIDFGYDFMTGCPSGTRRDESRPKLYTINTLKETYDIEKIEVVLPTHYHDDHVAGFNLLREIEKTKVWCPESFTTILEEPDHYNLPCLWYDPIQVDRSLEFEEKISWEEYNIKLYSFPGHTRYAAAIELEVDGRKVLAVGDQYQGEEALWNYVYKNRYQIGDYGKTARLLNKIKPDIILTGHWGAKEIDQNFIDKIQERDQQLEKIHRQLLPLDDINLGAEGFPVRIKPYQLFTEGGIEELELEIYNPFDVPEKAKVEIVCSHEGTLKENKLNYTLELPAGGRKNLKIELNINGQREIRRARLSADITIGDKRLGQQGEAFITVGRGIVDEN